MTTTTDDAAVLSRVLDRWQAAVDGHRPADVAALFTEDAVFQGLHPYTVGRDGVAAYYDSQPLGMKAAYRILETRRLADGVVLGYLAVEFSFRDRPPLDVKLSVVVTRVAQDWYLGHYQVSRLEQAGPAGGLRGA